MENNGVNLAGQNTNTPAQPNQANRTSQQQQVMGQVFSNILIRFMSIASENANNS